ncbi:MAG TPA: hypothetical protein VF458_07065 [Ktedonobacteraceae bacterium]
MDSRYAEYIRALSEGVLNGQGETSSELRNVVELAAARLSGSVAPEAGALPLTLENYIRKVALCACRITDADAENLHAAGYNDEAIFELTVSAALGAGMARIKLGLAALKGSGDAR